MSQPNLQYETQSTPYAVQRPYSSRIVIWRDTTSIMRFHLMRGFVGTKHNRSHTVPSEMVLLPCEVLRKWVVASSNPTRLIYVPSEPELRRQ